ncbi:sulfate adenylyltransferase subunit CysN [Methylosinus sp. Sm6]|uniref:sulfate adenylyltransferase subunit CysN n=1 Tax=Methylosinus sp. Sm6 TaxID=2866948 RepID=UPI001C990A02|nr:sulfate adenylyltransferase subunit CysN [Methylosinus sp. Sm6]MBY6240273.1 sulfate adenylyltransferase subunit CysN [Methylosinus sp. Sm6]
MHGGLASSTPPRSAGGPSPAEKPLLRFITCGSVDDGKSTLIGRLLYDADLAPDDLIAALERDSKKHGTQGDDLDFALLVDGLAAEREQGITIDVAYRYFATGKRKFIVADTPGHEQYTRNMATGASTAELAVLLVDARKGLLDQTRRHSMIVSMLGVRHVVVAVNKMDLVDYSQEVFAAIERDFRAFAAPLRFLSIALIPLVAKDGDNLVHASEKMGWYAGPPLLSYLENVALDDNARVLPLRFPVQWVNRPSHDFRGFSGFIAGGNVKPGDIVRILPAGRDTRISRIVTSDGDLAHAVAGQSVTLTLTEEIDVSRGDMLVSPVSPAEVGDRLSAKLLWLVREPLAVDKSYLLKLGTKTTPASVRKVSSHIRVESGLAEPLSDASATLAFNEIGEAELWLDTAVVCDPYADNRETGGFILIDRVTNETVAVGMVQQSTWTERSPRNGVEASYASMEGVPTPPREAGPTPLRSLVKALSWRVPGSLVTFGAAFVFTDDLRVSAAITGTEIACKIALYYLHERLWSRFRIGMKPTDDAGL